jgi:hypothetical protein
VGEAVGAVPSVVFETSVDHLLAGSCVGDIVSAFTSDAAVVIVALALGDGAVVVL